MHIPFRAGGFGILSVILISSVALADDVRLNWLEGPPPAVGAGVSWGVPFKQGEVKKDQEFNLTTEPGKGLALQDWPLAYWPDGSIKWMGFATVAGNDAGGAAKLSVGKSAQVNSVS